MGFMLGTSAQESSLKGSICNAIQSYIFHVNIPTYTQHETFNKRRNAFNGAQGVDVKTTFFWVVVVLPDLSSHLNMNLTQI
ncbi:CLUMA_CG014601, isoform A [Clunio marinus]|uniref:CLUMA_CG014601, isoform A n=1 Tax=Clunio marinus TaxID=568069 RepID=A0A1J1IND8_9DIPT|nr:CLUMA_CG014601, isoform A [Clunio marinus]